MELLFLAILVITMASALASGFPVAFSLPGSAILTIGLAAATGYAIEGDASAYFAHGGPVQWLSAGVTNFRGVYWEVERDTLIAIPLFVFMGIMLQRSKIAEDLLMTMAQLFGPVPGGLGISVVFVGALLAATTGIVGATVVAMGLISLPAMLRNNYSHALATGTIAASGTLGQIIPPSIVLIILADQLSSAVDQAGMARKTLYKTVTGDFSMPSEFSLVSASAGDMFLGAFIPGLLLVALYIIFIQVIALIKPKLAPPVPFDGSYDRNFLGKVLLALVPPLALIFVVLGSIITGVATVNQAGAIGAAGATMMAGYRLMDGKKGAFYPAIMAFISIIAIIFITSNYSTNIKNIKNTDDVIGITLGVIAVGFLIASIAWSGWRAHKIEDTLKSVMVETAKTSSLVFIILLGAAMLTAAFRAFGGEELVRDFLTSLPGGFWAQFIIVMAVIFLLGFFLDFIEIAVVVVPIVAPILLMDPSANVTAVWLGVMIGLNIQTSFLTPPFGFALFYLRGVAPPIVKTISMYKGVIAFIGLQLFALVIVGYYPPLVNYLPNRMSLLSDTAPPPLNPRLQYCVEEYVFNQFSVHGTEITAAIKEAKTLDYSFVPKKQGKAVQASLVKAESIQKLLLDIRTAAAILEAEKEAYRPVHRDVRAAQKRMFKIDSEVKRLTTKISRMKGRSESVGEFETKVADYKVERKQLEATIPEAWTAANKKYVTLLTADETARKKYRQTVDGAYIPISELLETVKGTERLAALRPEIEKLDQLLNETDKKASASIIADLSKRVGAIQGTKDIKSYLSKMRSAIKSKNVNSEKVLKAHADALKAFDKDMVWRTKAVTELLPGLNKYEAAIRGTIGLRQQPRLPKEQALEVAKCNSEHRDISLSF